MKTALLLLVSLTFSGCSAAEAEKAETAEYSYSVNAFNIVEFTPKSQTNYICIIVLSQGGTALQCIRK